jgi:hypothetical protein
MNGMLGGVLALQDGSLLRHVWGQMLFYSPDVLPTGLLQRSTDGARTWSRPEYIARDPKHQMTWPKRLRRLCDGRLVMTGSAALYELDTWTWEEQGIKSRACLWASKDPAGKSWTDPIYVAPDGTSTEEWDLAELENGDLLGVFRTHDLKRRQSLLVKHGETWEPGPLLETPFPHSGQPELLATREGVILHIASDGIWGTVDRGTNWTKLDVPGPHYYPSAVQLNDGTIVISSHVGSDDPYGKYDQCILKDSFRLAEKTWGLPDSG